MHDALARITALSLPGNRVWHTPSLLLANHTLALDAQSDCSFPFDGPLVLTVDGEDRTVGERVARQIFVTRDESSTSNKNRKETA